MTLWTDDQKEAAERLYLREDFSATETGRRIGKSRNAVISKAHREGWADERDPAVAEFNMRRFVRGQQAQACRHARS